MQNNQWQVRIYTTPFRRRSATFLVLACLVFAATRPSARAETLTFDDVASPDQIMALHPGWSYYQGGSGKASLETGGTGNCFSADFGNGFSPVYLSHAFAQPRDTVYIAFSLKVGPVERMLTRLELLRLTSAGQTDVRVNLLENRQILVSTNVTESRIEHYPGAYWWPNKWTRSGARHQERPAGIHQSMGRRSLHILQQFQHGDQADRRTDDRTDAAVGMASGSPARSCSMISPWAHRSRRSASSRHV